MTIPIILISILAVMIGAYVNQRYNERESYKYAKREKTIDTYQDEWTAEKLTDLFFSKKPPVNLWEMCQRTMIDIYTLMHSDGQYLVRFGDTGIRNSDLRILGLPVKINHAMPRGKIIIK